MGAIGDFDFNDVVLKLRYVSGEFNLYGQLCALGGTLETYLKFKQNGPSSSAFDVFEGTELHTALGYAIKGEYKCLNTETGEGIYPYKNFTIPVTGGFTIGADVSQLYLEVHQSGGSTTKIQAPGEYATGDRKAPQAFVIFDPNSNWKWAEERATMGKDVYSDFGSWGAYYKNEWYKNPDGKTYNAQSCTWDWISSSTNN